MIVVCRDNQGDYEPLIVPRDPCANISETNIVVSREWYTIDANRSGYCITVGREYAVYGIIFYGCQIRYLISDDNGIPGFFPSCLFFIRDSALYFDWQIREYGIEDKTLFLMGYPELCKTYRSFTGLIEEYSEDVKQFLGYKEYISFYF